MRAIRTRNPFFARLCVLMSYYTFAIQGSPWSRRTKRSYMEPACACRYILISHLHRTARKSSGQASCGPTFHLFAGGLDHVLAYERSWVPRWLGRYWDSFSSSYQSSACFCLLLSSLRLARNCSRQLTMLRQG